MLRQVLRKTWFPSSSRADLWPQTLASALVSGTGKTLQSLGAGGGGDGTVCFKKLSVISSSKSGCNSFLPEPRGTDTEINRLFAAPFPSPTPFAHLAGSERPHIPNSARGWGSTWQRAIPTLPWPPNPPKPATSSGCQGRIHPEPLPALNRNSPERCHGPRAKAEPPKLSCFDLNSRGGSEGNTARRTCLSAGAPLPSCARLRPRSGSQERNSCGKCGPGSARGDAVSGAAKHEAGKGAVFTSTPPKLVGAGFNSPSQRPEP